MNKKAGFKFIKFNGSIKDSIKKLKTKPAFYWDKKGESTALNLFQFIWNTVPAYRQFLENKGIDGEKIKTIEDFRLLPVTDKNSYLKTSEIQDLIPHGDLSKVTTFSATSGSSGEPFYFPRGEEQDWQYRYVAEIFLTNQFGLDKKRKTLGLIGFGLGIWIGGIFTYKNFNKLAAEGYNFSLVPIGPDENLFLKAIKKFGHLYDRVILMGYPPFIKDVIDRGEEYEVNWQDYDLKILTAAEGYSEKFIDYIAEKACLKNPLKDMVNIYGTVEIGTMAHDTPVTNLIRKLAVNNEDVFKAIFPQANRLPTLAQYHPQLVYFEKVNDEVIASGYGSSIPLLRYRFPDMGGVLKYDEMIAALKQAGVDILQELRNQKLDKTLMKLPFVYVYDRSDNTLSLYGANIYTEHIKDALQDKSVEKYLTGKFTMVKKEDKKMNPFLEIHIELQKNIRFLPQNLSNDIQSIVVNNLLYRNTEYNELKKKLTGDSGRLTNSVTQAVIDNLRDRSSEFANQYSANPDKVTPRIYLWDYQHPKYFKPGGKQKWII